MRRTRTQKSHRSGVHTWEDEGGTVATGAAALPRHRAVSAANEDRLRRIAFVGTHPPRQCGIATFTADLGAAVADALPSADCLAVAVTENGRGRLYPPRVQFEIVEGEVESYRRAAEFLNGAAVDAVSVQHEFGIFGGQAGSHVIELMQALEMPIVTTLHTVLRQPDPAQRAVMWEVARLSERVVIMSDHGAETLSRVYRVPAAKIDRIPHGVPEVPRDDGSKRRLALRGRAVLLTFGLLSPSKGIEQVIEALPQVVARHPNTTYVVVGATHPQVKRQQGEVYRLGLMARARELGVEKHTMFLDRFVTQAELEELLAAADVYVTPYLGEEQITSGTLAYAAGAGKAIVSTPYIHARELLADGRGIITPWNDSAAIGREIVGLLDDDERRLAIGERARAYGRSMRWPVVARAHIRSLGRARRAHAARARATDGAPLVSAPADSEPLVAPPSNLGHVRVMTDDVGLFQHAVGSVPSSEHGYCLDDNARALLLTTLLRSKGGEPGAVDDLDALYGRFVGEAYDEDSGRFRNFMSYERQWCETTGSEDSHGRALWALGAVVGRRVDDAATEPAMRLFVRALRATSSFTSPRAWAYSLLGIAEHARACRGDAAVESARESLSARLLDLFDRAQTPDWPWFEDRVTYCNARLSQALIASGQWARDDRMRSVGLQTLDWLTRIQRSREGFFAPIGSNGFYRRNGRKAVYDQQPVEAGAMVSACLEAARATGEGRWRREADLAFEWFLGRNTVGEPLYDVSTGGCRDGLHVGRLNENRGAESTLSFQLALVEMDDAAHRPAGQA